MKNTICVLTILLVITGCQSTNVQYDHERLGINYHLYKLVEPRPNRVHVLQVDLSESKIKPVVVLADDPDGSGPAEAALTSPLKLAQNRSVLAFINTNPWDSFLDVTGKKNQNWFEGQPVDIWGLAATDGRMRSPALPNNMSVWFDRQASVILDSNPEEEAISEGVAGFAQILKDGIVIAPKDSLHPRTSIGINQSGYILWLVVVDGRQKGYSEGMTTYELGKIMQELGCWHAVNMDGGGSSIMGLISPDGEINIVNSPSGRWLGKSKIRPLPMILTLQK